MASDAVPIHLGPSGRALWGELTGAWEFRPDELAIVVQACATLDVIAALEAVLADAPSVIAGSKGQDRLHPAVAELRLQRQAFASLLGKIAVPEPDERDGWDGLDASQRARRAARARWDRRGAA